MTPQTTSRRAFSSTLAYDYGPKNYLPNNYFKQYQTTITTIEREAQAIVLDALEAAVEGLQWESLGHGRYVRKAAVLALIQQQRSKP